MSTITTISRPPFAPSVTPSVPMPVDERGVARGVSWNFYDRLTEAIRERSSVRIAFDGKDVEIMVVGPVHEGLGNLLDMFIGEVSEGLDVDFHGLGSTTWKRQDVERGVEADLCYCFDPPKVTLCRAASARGTNDGAAFPIPDLAVEIDISPPKIDRPEIYSKLQVSEVWRFGGERVSIDQLDGSGNYVVADASRFLFVRAEEVAHWLREGNTMGRPAWKRAIREWARTELRARAAL
jgi:Uma2 family endonuclease